MSYNTVSLLNRDPDWAGRVRACVTQQAAADQDNPDLAIAALAQDVLRGGPVTMDTFVRTTSSAPGFDTEVDNGDGTIDQSKIQDGEILAAVQANFGRVATLFFDDQGNRIA